jgi:hypothetical protein
VERSVFTRVGPWTEAAYLALSHDGRAEIVDGALLIGPGAGPQRSRVIERVRAAVADALPDGLGVRGPVALRLGPDCVLVPDLVVVAAPPTDSEGDAESADAPEGAESAGNGGEVPNAAGAGDAGEKSGTNARDGESDARDTLLDAAAALMVIEVVGSDHGAADRSFKPQLYARSRIPYSLLIDHDAPFAVADMIISGRYHEYAHAGHGQRLRIEEPFLLDLDLDAVTVVELEDAATAALTEAPAEVS